LATKYFADFLKKPLGKSSSGFFDEKRGIYTGGGLFLKRFGDNFPNSFKKNVALHQNLKAL
jgi:hypothetical protein